MNAQKEFFNSMAEKWDDFCKHDISKIEYILSLLKIRNGAKILDVGTGTGILIPFLAEQVGEQGKIIAIDVSDKMIEVAQRKNIYDNVFCVCGDVLETDLPNEYFDFAICYSVFPHFDNKQLAINIISKYLKKTGKFVIFHSQSRETINNMHKTVSEAVASDNLPTLNMIRGYFDDIKLKTTIAIDNDKMFVIVAEK